MRKCSVRRAPTPLPSIRQSHFPTLLVPTAAPVDCRAAPVRIEGRRRPLALLRRIGQGARSRAVLPCADGRAASLVSPGQPGRRVDRQGRVHNIRFNSSFEAVNPALRDQCRGYVRNNVVHAQHGSHPTLCVIHGFMGSPYLFNGLFFSLPWFYRSGYDVLLYTLPFHGQRAERGSPFSGYGYFAHGFSGFAEAMAQAVHDFRSVIDYLEFTGVDRVALTGMSIGGYTSALIACVDDRIQAVIPNVPVVTPDRTVDEWFPANHVVRLRSRITGTDDELTRAATMYPSPPELCAPGTQGPAPDHRRTRRSAGTT
jgi:dienelactone hydrolase